MEHIKSNKMCIRDRAAIAIAAKLLDMQNKGDYLEGDVFVSTQICPHAPTAPHKPVPFMGSPVEMSQVNREEVSPELDAILSVDTTKGNRVINTRGFAISPTVKEGWILRTSEDPVSYTHLDVYKRQDPVRRRVA